MELQLSLLINNNCLNLCFAIVRNAIIKSCVEISTQLFVVFLGVYLKTSVFCMDLLATATVVSATAATTVISCSVVTAAAEQEDKDDNPSATATTKAIITHNQDLLFCLSSHTMLKVVKVLQFI